MFPLVELDEVLVSSFLQAGILRGIELLFWRLILHVKIYVNKETFKFFVGCGQKRDNLEDLWGLRS